MGAAVLSILLTTTSMARPNCHIFRVWHYRYPQRCFVALAYAKPASRIHETSREQIRMPVPQPDFEIRQPHAVPWPELDNIDWGRVGDERLIGNCKNQGFR